MRMAALIETVAVSIPGDRCLDNKPCANRPILVTTVHVPFRVSVLILDADKALVTYAAVTVQNKGLAANLDDLQSKVQTHKAVIACAGSVLQYAYRSCSRNRSRLPSGYIAQLEHSGGPCKPRSEE